MIKFAPSLTAALRANGLKGPIRIKMFGDLRSLDSVNRGKWRSTGIQCNPVPKDPRHSARKFMFWDVLEWVERNPPPAHLFFYLCCAATIMWH